MQPSDEPLDLDSSTIIELKRLVVSAGEEQTAGPDDVPDLSPSRPRCPTEQRELLNQRFEAGDSA